MCMIWRCKNRPLHSKIAVESGDDVKSDNTICTQSAKMMTWYETSVACRLQQSQLVSLNTHAEWTSMSSFLIKYRPPLSNCPLGLRTTPKHEQSM